MGIPMANNLHAPTVSSGPTSGGIPRDLSKLSMGDLTKHKENIEEELSALSSVLTSVRSLSFSVFYDYSC
jgi:26S proteasome non-ATPase regulatory subunit 9